MKEKQRSHTEQIQQ